MERRLNFTLRRSPQHPARIVERNAMNLVLEFKDWIINEDTKKYSCVMAVFDNPQLFISRTKKHVAEKDVFEEEGIEEESHATALYGLHTNDYKVVEDHIKGFKPFDISLGKVSKFDTHPNYDVLKVEVKGDQLFKLNKLLRQLPYTSKYDKYIPHCTLAYVHKGTCEDLIGNDYFIDKKIKVKELTFSSNVRKKTKIKLGQA